MSLPAAPVKLRGLRGWTPKPSAAPELPSSLADLSAAPLATPAAALSPLSAAPTDVPSAALSASSAAPADAPSAALPAAPSAPSAHLALLEQRLASQELLHQGCWRLQEFRFAGCRLGEI